jgi:ATP-binding cassette subfamily B protein
MPRQYSMGARTPPQGASTIPGQAPTSIRERVGALRNLPPFLKLVWQTSPAISVAVIVLRLVRALLPVATLYVGALIIDAVVKGIPSGEFGPIWRLLALEFALAVLSDILGRGVSLLDSLLGERFSIATSLRLMQHAATLDLEDFEDSEVQDRLERARQQASGRTGLMSQLFNQAQDVVTIVSFGAGLFVYAPWLLVLMAVALVPAFIGEVHFNAQAYWMNYTRAPERRESDYVRQTAASVETAKEVNTGCRPLPDSCP